MEKDALYFLTSLTALLERRVTPRLVNIVNYNDEVVESRSEWRKQQFKVQIPAQCFPEFVRYQDTYLFIYMICLQTRE